MQLPSPRFPTHRVRSKIQALELVYTDTLKLPSTMTTVGLGLSARGNALAQWAELCSPLIGM
jgi:hypothetical protein